MNRPGIEPRSLEPLANTQLIRSIGSIPSRVIIIVQVIRYITEPSCIVVGSDEIKEMKVYIHLGGMVTMCRDMDEEISWRIKTGWKVFTTIKDVIQVNLDKTQCAYLFNGTVLPAML